MNTIFQPFLEVLEDRHCPTTFNPGGALASPQLTNLYVGSVPNEDAFSQVLVNDYAPLLAAYGEGQGAFRGSVSIPDPGGAALDYSWINQEITALYASGQLAYQGPDSILMVYLPRPVSDSWASAYAAYNTQAHTPGGMPVPIGVVWTQLSETIPASHEFAEASTGQQICDPYDWQSFTLNTYQVSEFSEPDGSEYQPPMTTTTTTTGTILEEEQLFYFYALYEYEIGNISQAETALALDYYLAWSSHVLL